MDNKRSVIKQKTIEHFEKLCQQHGLPLTIQRRVILKALVDRDDHPTADQIFEDIKALTPGVSRTTVYRALETLVRLGVARKAKHYKAAARFDANTGRHHHLVCLKCDKMADLDDPSLDQIGLPHPRRTGFEIIDYSVYFEGLCSECRQKKDEWSDTHRLDS